MASSDSTGFHRRSWRFHQFSSSGQVLRATSGCTLEMTDGSIIALSGGGQINDENVQLINTTGGTVINNRGLTIVDIAAAGTSEVALSIAAPPALGAMKRIVVLGDSSTILTMACSSATATISVTSGTVGGTSGPFGFYSSSALAGASHEIVLAATGSGGWRWLNSAFDPLPATFALSTAIIA